MRSAYDGVRVLTAIRPTTVTGTGTPVAAAVKAVDTFGYNTALFDVATGSPTGTPVTYTVQIKLQECATSTGTYTDITGAIGTITGTTTSAYLRAQVRLEGLNSGDQKRYIKVYALFTPSPNDGTVMPIAAQAILGRAFQEPVDNSASQSSAS